MKMLSLHSGYDVDSGADEVGQSVLGHMAPVLDGARIPPFYGLGQRTLAPDLRLELSVDTVPHRS